MFSGGNQSKITEKIGGTTLHKIMMDRYKTKSLSLLEPVLVQCVCLKK